MLHRSMSTELVKRDTVEDLVNYRNSAIQRYREFIDARTRLNETWNSAIKETYGAPNELVGRDIGLERFTKELDAGCWRRATNMTQIQELMDVAARRKFSEQIRSNPPEFTTDNVLATLSHLMASAGDIFKSSVIKTFEALPRDYRSNDGFKYGKRIIFDYAFDPKFGFSFYGHEHAAERLHDLDRVMNILDGGKFDDKLDAVKVLCAAVDGHRYSKRKEPIEAKSKYFEMKMFRKGSLHIKPTRKDLLTIANKLLAEHYGWALADSSRD